MATTLPHREDVPAQATWDIASLFATLDDWERAYAELEGALDSFAAFRDTLTSSAPALLAWIAHVETVRPKAMRVLSYASLRADQDLGNQANAGLASRARGLLARLGAALSFAEPELLAAAPATLDAYLAGDPQLARYRHYFDNLARKRPHVRSAEVEEVLAQSSDVFNTIGSTYALLANTDIKFADASDAGGAPVQVGQSNMRELLASEDRALRKSAYESFARGFIGVKNTMASNLAAKVKAAVFVARARRYEDVLGASLDENNVPRQVYDNVIDACNRHLPIWHRYWEARRKLLKLDVLEPCDIFAPIAPQVRVPYAQAVEWICAGMAPLGDEYVAKMRAGLTVERWVDQPQNQGKRQGAYSNGVFGGKSFIMMSYSETAGLPSMSTLAHEVGHSMHSTLSNRHQPYLLARYSLFAAEVASNFNQALTRAWLLEQNTERDFQIAVIEEAMGNLHRYLFLMPILSQFEHYAHQQAEQGRALTADGMSAQLAGLFRRAYGPAMRMDDALEGITWAQFNHLYMNFYVYQYASGIAAANALADTILREPARAGAYLEFLRSGGGMYPLDALKLAGIDMSTQEPMDRAFGVLERFVARLEALAE